MTLTISLPAEAESKLKERAKAAGQDVAQFVEHLLAREINAFASKAADLDAALDAQYARGYRQIPEDIGDVTALLPHLAVDVERWE